MQIFAAGHPCAPDVRRKLLEFGRPVTIGENVWIDGRLGVTIGDDAIIGASSIATRYVAAGMTVAGKAPARALRR